MRSSGTATTPSTQSGPTLVSIVITNYNYGRYLRTAIDSALAQTYSPVEVIVVDDGSTDESREVIESYEKRIAPIIKANGGHGSAINAGFAASRGEIVIFLDADDELLPEAVDRVVEAWHPGVAKAQFQLEMVDERGTRLGMRVPTFDDFIPNGDIRDRIARFGEYPSSPSSGNAYSRAALNRLMPMDESIWVAGAEKSLVFLTPFFGDVVSLCTPLGRYRIHEANDSRFEGRHLEALHRRLSAVYFIPETICRIAASKGIELDPRVLGSTSRELKLRMASIRLDPKTHPIARDTRLKLLVKGIRATLREPDIGLRIRATQSAWFVLMATAPMAVVSRLIAPSR
ncbi:glycosyltransferase family 2 protein [Candidatus Binatus sp.]|jgi:glycosyltransferase involved in cell wall biosynthesis|uniref:glycosyltransferase family 2 protein n=1 Tax=Candidatus Binatus sp. TaxID=2811406 RepID=UPI003C43984A